MDLENQGFTKNGILGKTSSYRRGSLYKALQDANSDFSRDPQGNVLYNALVKPMFKNKRNCNWGWNRSNKDDKENIYRSKEKNYPCPHCKNNDRLLPVSKFILGQSKKMHSCGCDEGIQELHLPKLTWKHSILWKM